jgi:hypothetical protein
VHSHLNYLRRKIAFRAANWLHRIDSLADTPKGVNVMLVTVRHELAEAQLYPFHFYRQILAGKHGVDCAQIGVDAVMADAALVKTLAQHRHIKRVFFQPAFEMPAAQMVKALECLTQICPNARIAFTDWYGEVCWRDYDAHATGALLMKPDMSHLRALPDVFVAFETYVPLKWDLSDFGENVEHYLRNHEGRSRIVRQGCEANASWVRSQDFAGTIAGMCA